MTRTMLNGFNSPKLIVNCGRLDKPNISYFHPFGCECFILNTKDNLGMFDPKSIKRLCYSNVSKEYNSRTLTHIFLERQNKNKIYLQGSNSSFLTLKNGT
ncbi:hypothetical protein CR513_28810, partial [Mucuna pruriens]